MSREPDETLDVLRGVWSARGQGPADLDEATGHGKSCKRMANVGFQDMAEDDADLRAAWRWWTLAELDSTAAAVWPSNLADLIRQRTGGT